MEKVIDHKDILLRIFDIKLQLLVVALDRGLPDAVKDKFALIQCDLAAHVLNLLLAAAIERGSGTLVDCAGRLKLSDVL